jgi:Zn-dependent protease/CBS domain-containing protein
VVVRPQPRAHGREIRAVIGRGFKLVTIAGIRIIVHPSWFIIFGLVVASLASVGALAAGGHLPTVPRWIVAFLVALLFFVSVLVHEMAHALVARARGLNVSQVTLFLFGGAAALDEQPPTAATEALVAGAGPLSSALLGVLFMAGTVAFANVSGALGEICLWTCRWLGFSNLVLAAFNLIPGFPMDGGRLLRAGVWAFTRDFVKATRVASLVGRVVGQLVIIGGLWFALEGDLINGIWLVLIGWFLNRAAAYSLRQVIVERLVEGVVVRDVMESNVPVVSQYLTLDTLADQTSLHERSGFFAVIVGDELVGTIDINQIKRVPRNRWATTRVAEVMRQGDKILSLTEPQPILDAVSRFEESGAAALPVVSVDGRHRLLGMITRESLLTALQARARAQAATHP